MLPPLSGLQILEQPWIDFQRTRPTSAFERCVTADLDRSFMGLHGPRLPRRDPHPRGREEHADDGAGPSGTAPPQQQQQAPGQQQPPQQQEQQPQQPLQPWAGGIVQHCAVLTSLAGSLALSPPSLLAAPATPGPCAKYYRRLWQSLPVTNAVKCFCVRLMHAALPCRAMMAFKFQWGRDRATCACCRPSPAAQGGAIPLETYTHIFFECPAFAGAKDWLLDLWAHISGCRPPDTAAVIVADEPGAWPADQQPQGDRALLWQALRLTLLRHIWAARCSGDPQQQHAHAVVSATISFVRAEIQQQYNCAFLRDQLMRVLPARSVRQQQQRFSVRQPLQQQQQQRPPADRLSMWLHPAIASIAAGPTPAARGAAGPGAPQRLLRPSQHLTLHLSLVHPVPAPPAPQQ